jgi:hypothetical protein
MEPAFIIISTTAPAAGSLVRTADPTDRGLIVGSAVWTERLFLKRLGVALKWSESGVARKGL